MEETESIIGKRILVGLTYVDDEDQVVDRDTFHGPVISVSESTISIERSDTGEEFSIPNDNLYTADPENVYTLNSGEEVSDVYVTSIWTISAPEQE